ncbi:MAG: hypothetical protein CM15mP49_31050 [Actinomycetota bacterium]|nr:MAG: hypothetical protein CM15mP49_31050 [Actinomycetota bacterium]
MHLRGLEMLGANLHQNMGTLMAIVRDYEAVALSWSFPVLVQLKIS